MNIVIYTQRVEIIESYNERRDCADQRIAEFLWHCGYIPVPTPNDSIKTGQILNTVNPVGIVLTGGNSLVEYGGNAPERDSTDRECIKFAIENTIPLYGFCRGMQSILDYFGNNLVNVSGHIAVNHLVIGSEDSIEVNSYHSQGCINLDTEELEVFLRSEDGVIEKVRHKSLPIVGTMWHPERENPFRDVDIDMVRELFGGIKQ